MALSAALGLSLLLGGGVPVAAAVCDGVRRACQLGDTGPGGGVVFHDAGSPRKWGRYLEAAPAGWEGERQDLTAKWCPGGLRSPAYRDELATGTGVGSGRANTRLIVDACGEDSAAGVATMYRGGGQSDWFLPSKAELNLMYRQRAEIEIPAGDDFWSSSQSRRIWTFAWAQGFGDGYQGEGSKSLNLRVRPVRAF